MSELERDSPAVVNARAKLWETLKALDAELQEAQHALTVRTKDRPLREFVRRLAGARVGIAKLHACAYANSLVERHDAWAPRLKETDLLAAEAGIVQKEPAPEEKPGPRIWTPPSNGTNGANGSHA